MAKAKLYHLIWGAFSFAGVISLFQINSYWADKHNFNGFFGWLGIGIACLLVAAYFLYKVIKNTGSGGGSSVQ